MSEIIFDEKKIKERYQLYLSNLQKNGKIPPEFKIKVSNIIPFQWALYFDKHFTIDIKSSKQYALEKYWEFLGGPFDENTLLKLPKKERNWKSLDFLKDENRNLLSKLSKTVDLAKKNYENFKKELHSEDVNQIPEISKDYKFDKDKLPVWSYEFFWVEPDSIEFDFCPTCDGRWVIDCPTCHWEWFLPCSSCSWKGFIEYTEKRIEKQQITCPTCHGMKQAKIPCKICNGYWKIQKEIITEERCPSCSWRWQIVLQRQMQNPYWNFPSWHNWQNSYWWNNYGTNNDANAEQWLKQKMNQSAKMQEYERQKKEKEALLNQQYLNQFNQKNNNHFSAHTSTCPSCGGEWKLHIRKMIEETCQVCHWVWWFTENCSHCSATGFLIVDKEVYDQKQKKCENCWGTWRLECLTCAWTREVMCHTCNWEQKMFSYTLNLFSVDVEQNIDIIFQDWIKEIKALKNLTNWFIDKPKVKKDLYWNLQTLQETRFKQWKEKLNKDKLKIFEWYLIEYKSNWKVFYISDVNWFPFYDFLPSKFDLQEKIHNTTNFIDEKFKIIKKLWNKMWERKEQ